MSNKIGFWSLLSIVIGSQVGSGVFMLPSVLGPYGTFSIAGWVISGCGAIALAVVFSMLCSKLPKTGGPHAYVEEAFGRSTAFFIGWAYWVVSWVSTVAVIVASIGYLSPFIGNQSSIVYVALEILLLLSIVLLNLRGASFAGKAEFFLTTLKFIPLLILPLLALRFFNGTNFVVSSEISSLSTPTILGQVTMLTMWGFIGVEVGTTPAGSVKNPTKTIPRAIVAGTVCVALLYLINSISIMGLISPKELAVSKAPYVDAAQRMFGGNWHLLVSIITSVVCVGTLNAWVLASSQIMLGLAEDGFVPKFFKYKNSYSAPVRTILSSSIGIVPLLILTGEQSLAKQITIIIDISVIVFLFVYLTCSLACLKLALKKRETLPTYKWAAIIIATIFCIGVIYETPIKDLLISSLFVLSGVPVYLLMRYKSIA